ncbi:MAG: HAD hydrolase-like protein, partial [Promethearchaeota archaeon]
IFFSIVKQPEEIINPIIDKFYETEFPKLQIHFTTRPNARPLMKEIFIKNYKVVIATTPLLPEIAIRQRLDWAGVGDFPYHLITTIENSYVSKSLTNLLYYKNIIDEIDLPAELCLMVGDEAKDMIAANLGCKTFLVDSPNTNLDDSIPEPTYHGTLADLRNLI